MDKIIADTSTTQWQTLVSEASHSCRISLPEEIESYLVFLLMRFTDSPQMAHNVMAMEFLYGLNKIGAQKSQTLRDVGDQCLLYSGLFPGRAKRRLVRLSYYVNIGKSAYLTLSSERRFSHSGLFASLADKFVALMDILQSMRELNNKDLVLDPIGAAELWQDTGSQHALSTLQKFTTHPQCQIYDLQTSAKKH